MTWQMVGKARFSRIVVVFESHGRELARTAAQWSAPSQSGGEGPLGLPVLIVSVVDGIVTGQIRRMDLLKLVGGDGCVN
ncbi:hypothetical protein [Arthrobacter sp. H35-D1]|uniref:hypothetical protein n=1 Tax=Arthrobacter sp. H35-D1 TaxID=3046202 RepID=UPI0024B91463|nr:hypothetical protein [Arthrobacter sp. H35-D1]MDJ0313595.1 hypothetical protein [Arthrobacter sp. H35-D1]